MLRRFVVVAVGWPLVMAGCSGKGTLGSPDGGLGGGFGGVIPDARVDATPQPGFTVDGSVTIHLACSSGGDALAFYADAAAVQVRRFHAGAWSDPSGLPFLADAVRAVAMSPDGAGTFAWASPAADPPDTVDVNVARLAPSGEWSGPTRVGDGGIGWWQEPSPPVPVLALDGAGETFVAWSRIDQLTETPLWPSAVWSSALAADGTVTGASIDQPGGTSSTVPSLLARGSGDAVAAWGWDDASRTRLLVAHRVGSGWKPAKILEEIAGTGVGFVASDGPRLVGDGAGGLVIVYQRVSGSNQQLIARRSADGETWTDAVVLAPAGATWFQVADNGAGGAVVMWSDLLATVRTATMRVLDPNTGWSGPSVPVPEGVGQAQAAMHPDGRIALLSLQKQPDASWATILQRYAPATGWQASELVGHSPGTASSLCFAGDTLLVAWNDLNTFVAAFP